ncbi:MAG: thioredoxin [Chlamydiia bacterium]|nr:thioredoxin [Chlamydiia bacterium]
MAASSFIKLFTDDNFDASIKEGVVLVDFYADWCGPCRMLTPVIEELAKEMQGKITVAKVDTDQSINVATKYEVTSIPTLILFKDGAAVDRVVGLKDLDSLREMVTRTL